MPRPGEPRDIAVDQLDPVVQRGRLRAVRLLVEEPFADVLPAIGATQPVQLILLPDFVGGNRIEIPVTTRATPTRMEFDVAAVPPGDYYAMIDVNGQFTDRFGPVTI